MRRISLWVFLVISVMCVSPHSFANTTQEFTLQNGLKVIVRVDHRAPVVMNSIWYKVGASYENNGKTGISHMLEHMMFKGSEKYPTGVFNQLMDEHGAIDNANTTDDYTVYYQTIKASQLELCFQLEADRMHNLLFDDKLFQKERQVVAEERRMRVDNDPQSIAWERFRAAAFINNPYHHPVIGWMTDIQHYTLDDLRAWYHDWYAPNNAVIVVIGDVNPDHVLALAKKYFGAIKTSSLPVIKPRTEVQPLGEKEIHVDIKAQLPWLVMGYQVPTLATDANKNEVYALLLCAQILSGGDSARFSTDLIRKLKIAVSAEASYDRYDLYKTLFVLSGTPTSNQNTLNLKNAIINEINRLKLSLVTLDELDRAKVQIIANKTYENDSLMKQAFDLGVPEMVGLSWRESDHFAEHVRAVTPQEIQAVAKKYFTQDNLTVAYLAPK